MKTKAIKRSINDQRGYALGLGGSTAASDESEAELAVLETENAVKDEALRDAHEELEAVSLNQVVIECVEAALSSESTGKVLVDREKLDKLANGWHGTDGIEIGLCPVCAGKDIHYETCWLAALLELDS